MVYIFGFIGFIFGFAIGLGVINVLLRNHKISEIKQNKSVRWIYGLTVWGLSGLGSYIGVIIYGNYFY